MKEKLLRIFKYVFCFSIPVIHFIINLLVKTYLFDPVISLGSADAFELLHLIMVYFFSTTCLSIYIVGYILVPRLYYKIALIIWVVDCAEILIAFWMVLFSFCSNI